MNVNEQALLELMSEGNAPHYAFIIDRSPVGVMTLDRMEVAPMEIQERVTNPHVQIWKQSPYEFLIIWGTWGCSGGLTIQAYDVDELLNDALPLVLERTLFNGGYCSFIPMVADDIRDQLTAKLAELHLIPISNTLH